MLKENIYVWVDILGEREFETIYDLVKEYFRTYKDWKIDRYNEITYRNRDLCINDADGFTDATTIWSDLIEQVNKINEKLDGE